jgi:NADPH-dependent curcumin reductase CurA
MNAVYRGIGVGSKLDYEHLTEFIEEHDVDLEQLLDSTFSGKTFSFEESPEAFEYLYSGKHVGKVVIKISA